MTFKEFVKSEKEDIQLQTYDLVADPSFASYIEYVSEQLDSGIDYLSYVDESLNESINYANYVAEHLYVDKGYVDSMLYDDYTRYDSRKKVYDKRKRIIKKLLDE